VNNVDFELPAGELHAIIGPERRRQDDLLQRVSGFPAAERRPRVVQRRGITGWSTHRISRLGMARTLQVKSVFNGLSV